VQVPNDAYTISGTTITFTSAPSAGTQNVYVRYLSTTTQAITPSQGTVSWSTLDSNVQGDLGISFKNRIINSNMAIDQRNAGASVTLGSGAVYCLDRWVVYSQAASKFTVQQNAGSITPPIGFTNYLGLTVASAVSLGSADQYMLQQRIEGYNVADLGFGTANAKTITISFQVYSSLTGTFAGVICNSAENRTYPFTYTISSANTWTTASVTIAGDTTGTWLTTNGVGLWLKLNLGTGATYSGTANAWTSSPYISSVTGSVNVVATAGATFYLTGVQLEVGTQATTFTTAGGSYGAELALCQRYCQVISIRDNGFVGFNNSTTIGWFGYYPPVVMRTLPTLGTTGTASNYRILYAGGATACSVIPSMVSDQGTGFYRIEGTVASGLTAGQGSMLIGNNAAYNISFLAEL
jgi:hypothetical protein